MKGFTLKIAQCFYDSACTVWSFLLANSRKISLCVIAALRAFMIIMALVAAWNHLPVFVVGCTVYALIIPLAWDLDDDDYVEIVKCSPADNSGFEEEEIDLLPATLLIEDFSEKEH